MIFLSELRINRLAEGESERPEKVMLNVKLGDTVIFLIDEWGSGTKSDFDGIVMAINDNGIDVLYLSGHRSSNDFVPWSDVLAKLDKRVKRVSVPGTSYEGHFVLAPNK